MKVKLNSGNVVTLQSQDYITDNCWVCVEGSSFAERFNITMYMINGGKVLPIVAQSIDELEGVFVTKE
jgi:hypothetical protein